MAKVITTDAAAFAAFTQATQHAQSRANAAEAERAATEAARLALPTQMQAITGPAVAAAQAAASLAQQRAGVLGSAANDAALAGRAAGDYRVGTEIVSWNGSAVTARTGVLASEADAQETRTKTARIEDVLLASADTTDRERLASINIQTRIRVNAQNYLKGDGTLENSAAYYALMLEHGAGRYVIWPEGTYLIKPDFQMNLPANSTHDFSDGLARLIIAPDCGLPADAAVFGLTTANLTLIDLNLDVQYAQQARRMYGLLGYRAANIKLIRPTVRRTGRTGLFLSGCPEAYIESPDVRECGRKRADLGQENGYPGIDVMSDVGLSAADIDAGYDGRDSKILGGIAENNGLDGIGWGCRNGLISGVKARYNGYDETGVGAAGIYYYKNAHGTIIRDNVCEANSSNGIDTGPNAGGVIRGISILNNVCAYNRSSGIQADDVDDLLIEGNRCFDNNNQSSSPTKQTGGIVLATGGTVNNARVRNNRSFDTRPAGQKTQEYGLSIGIPEENPTPVTLTNLDVEGNDFEGNKLGAIGRFNPLVPPALVTGGFGRWRGNLGHTPTVTAPQTTGGYAAHVPYTASRLTVAPPAPASFRGITAGRLEDTLTLWFANGNATLQQVAGGAGTDGNWRLRGLADVTPPVNSNITFVWDGATWIETGRSF